MSGDTVGVDNNGQLGIILSSARYKRDIAPTGTRSAEVLDLRPVIFAYRDDTQGVMHYGLLAEEVAAIFPELVTRTPAGETQTVRYQELIPMLLNELQRQQTALERQQQEAVQRQERESAELARLRKELAELRVLVQQQTAERAGGLTLDH